MKQLKFECPECGTEFTITANQPKAKERIEALKKAGIDVSNLFAMQGADGSDFVASVQNGVISILYNPQIEMFARFKMKSSFHKTKRII